jgi:GTP-binding protein HflX
VRDADLILHVVDGADEAPEDQIAAVREVLAEIGAAQVPELIVINKADVAEADTIARLLRREPHAVVVSARTGEGMGLLADAIEVDLPGAWIDVDVLVPYARGDLLSRAHREGEVIAEEHGPDGTRLKARVPAALAGQFQATAHG